MKDISSKYKLIVAVLIAVVALLITGQVVSHFKANTSKSTTQKKTVPSPTPLKVTSKDDLKTAVKALNSQNLDNFNNNLNQFDKTANSLK